MASPELGHKHLFADDINRILAGGKNRWEKVLESLDLTTQAIRQHPWRTISIFGSVASSFVGWDLLHERNIPRALGLEKNQTMVGVQLPDLKQSRQIALAEFTATPKPEPSLTSTLTAKTPTPETTATPKSISVPPEESREFPKRIEIGQFGQYTKGISLKEATQLMKESDSDKPFLNLRISNPDSIGWAVGNVREGTIFGMQTNDPVDFVPLYADCKVVSDSEYGVLLNRGLKEPVVVVTTEAELAKYGPEISPRFIVAIPGKGNYILLEIILTPARSSLPNVIRQKNPGETVGKSESIVTIEKGNFIFKYVYHLKDGTRVSKGDLYTDVIQINNHPAYLQP